MPSRLLTTEVTVQPGSRVRRLLQLLWILQSCQGWSCSQIAGHFQVSRRTIFRDIQILRDSGIPVFTDGTCGGYKLTNSALLKCPDLEVLELLALAMLHNSPELAKVDLLQRAATMAIAKLMSAVPGRVRNRVQALIKELSLLTGKSAGIAGDSAKLDHFLALCLERTSTNLE
ncbi:helix-turn-helix transcriptional regulator [Anatilimnocola sp. NA78]|uniref:helix-turn-helix transcriptional regulator n=1 Tax=Anatilimnocola sp. NA78 TaxID=3415683 RepID=UPI003CE4B3B9